MRVAQASPWRTSVLVALALVTLAAACSRLPRPELLVSPDALTLGVSQASGFAVANVGEPGSTLRFAITTETPWVLVDPSAGHVEAGRTASVTVRVREGQLPPEHAAAELLVTSNAGSRIVRVAVGEFTSATVCARDSAPFTAARTGHAAPPQDGALAIAAPASATAPVSADEATLEVLVFHHPTVVALATPVGRIALASELAARAGARLLRAGSGSQHDLMLLPAHAPEAALAALERDARVASVVPNVPVQRLAIPNDPFYDAQWWSWCFGLEEAWRVTTGATSAGPDAMVVVAIIDDGFNVGHADLTPKLLPGFDFAEWNDDVSTSASPHGTHVAGIALAAGDNRSAIAGVAHGAAVRLLPVKVFPDDGGNGRLDALFTGMRWAVGLPVANAPPNAHPAQVVNLSLGVGSSPTMASAFESVLREMRERGAVVVAAAGNAGSGAGVEYPARSDGVIAVGSVDWTGVRSGFSTYGFGLDLMAPGGAAAPSASGTCRQVLSLGPVGATSTFCLAGTSMAAPFVSGTAALLIAHDPPRYRGQPAAVAARLSATALLAHGMSSGEYGAGIVCPDAALGAPSRCGWPGATSARP